MPRYGDYLYVLATVSLMVYGQSILKWCIAEFGPFPADTPEKLKFVLSLFSEHK
uniref:Uncharacterized protein n=1 Tax=Candidatus Kentrum eta TaxID=2126337 RepID=A0A450UVV2_9GAMM|nr:MAG: hypothetical protein BECKH772A_GA0070896_1009411 [Candidatus Kentron sp. H]VFJ96655.1 MAG: hypothetical protein BECKH772B_GA0070898_1009512 [Candidatus Kentron sp. H]VFK02490.1 MAG: hypothetical protein BECKH772C_GA0070978_1009211 [Candidatus Kentron sp. H]